MSTPTKTPRRPNSESEQAAKNRRDQALKDLVARIPYITYMGIQFERRGDELTGILPYRDDLIGNPSLPALHGGVISAFLEVTSLVSLGWAVMWPNFEAGDEGKKTGCRPKTIDLTVDFMRTGLPRDAYARAKIVRSGRRYASVHAEAWQGNRDRPIAMATGHFLMPSSDD